MPKSVSESANGDTPGWRPSGLCAVFACDIASFGDRSRTDHARTRMRAALYGGLRTAFDEAGIPYSECYGEDRGDGAMIVVPPRFDTGLLLSSVVELLRAELRAHNSTANDITQIRLRVAVNTGEAHWDGDGLVGSALNHAFRILEADPFKKTLAASGAHVGLVVSDRVYEDVVRHGGRLVDPDDYQRIEVEVKETVTTAWMRLPGMRLPGMRLPEHLRPGTDRPATLLPDTAPDGQVVSPDSPDRSRPLRSRRTGDPTSANRILFELADRMQQISVMAVERSRDQVVSMLSAEIAGMIPRHADARADILSIVRTCLDYSGGMDELVTVIRGFAGDSLPVLDLEQSIERFSAE